MLRASVLRNALALAVLVLATACAAPARWDPFSATGEVIAMGGGDAGADRACFTCHGLDGRGDGETAPRLAGLPAGYLQKQLEDYAAGLRPHGPMRSVASALSPEARRRVADYYAAMPAPAPTAPPPRRPPEGVGAMLYRVGDPARDLPACADCHGADGRGVGPANPPLAGQPAAYLAAQMHQWRRSERRNDPRGAMLQISRRLTPAEVAAVARYAAAADAGS